MSQGSQYKAYISYSHQNERWAKWLLQAIESYRVPRKLVGMTTKVGEVPARVRPVFRDRDELSSATDLGSTVHDALFNSENLLIICSPAAAKSHWVNEEIREFARLGKKDRIFCIIVEGEPDGTDEDHACFPPALAEIGLKEPLAADVRNWADGKHLSRLKLISAMLGLSLDQLRRRDLQKRQKGWAMAAVASVVLAAVLVVAVTSRISAQQRRVSGESLVAYKLNELRTLLNVTDDPENLSRLNLWSEAEIEQLIAQAGSGSKSLSDAGLDLRDQGNELYASGSLAAAMEKYQQSWLVFAVDYQRDRKHLNSLFELGQAEFYIGQVYVDLGNFAKAKTAFTHYAEITRRLIMRQPENAEWVLEMAYALNNLGSLNDQDNVNHPERRLQLMQSALEYNQIALVLDPDNGFYQAELGQSHAFFADAQRGVCDLEGALESRQKNVSLEQQVLDADNTNLEKMGRLAWALSGYSTVLAEAGKNDEASQSLRRAIGLMTLYLKQYPEDMRAALFLLSREQRLLELLVQSEGSGSYRESMDDLERQWQSFSSSDRKLSVEASRARVDYILDRAWLAESQGNDELAAEFIDESFTKLIQILSKLPGHRDAENQLVEAAFYYWQIKGELPPETVLVRLPEYEFERGRARACTDASMAVRKSLMLGDRESAARFSAYLLEKSYHEERFMQICESYALCTG